MKFSFRVGATEPHDVSFKWGLWGDAIAQVDGQEVLRERHLFNLKFKRVRRYAFGVGRSESHNVVIEHTFPRFFAGLAEQDFRVLVDGREVRRYRH